MNVANALIKTLDGADVEPDINTPAARRFTLTTSKKTTKNTSTLRAAEFFAGIGLARIGLERAGFSVVWANDIDRDKQQMYAGHFKDAEDDHKYVLGDIGEVNGRDLPSELSLAWASFPCTDLSLAGNREGLKGEQSGTFWQFVRVLREQGDSRPPVVALENVNGLATSHGGADMEALIKALNNLGYSVDILTLDARRFVPQSRPRLFIVGAMNPPQQDRVERRDLRPAWLDRFFENPALKTHRAVLPAPPPLRSNGLTKLIEEIGDDPHWWDTERTNAFLASLTPIQAARLDTLKNADEYSYRTAYRRTRNKVPVWEIRSDDISGCLRTARGGSSKQAVVKAGKGEVQVRWMTPREYAALMGAPDYNLENLRRNQALFGFGDAVCVDAVAWVAEHYLRPVAEGGTCLNAGLQAGESSSQPSALRLW